MITAKSICEFPTANNTAELIKIPDLFLDQQVKRHRDRKPIKFLKNRRQLNHNKFVHSHTGLMRIRFRKDNIKEGRWEKHEHEKFINACLTYGNNWKKIEEEIKTRTAAQIRSHAQKFIIKLCKKYNIKLKSKRFCGTNILNFDSRKISPCKMSSDEKKLLDIFNYYNLEFYSNPFAINQIHKNHSEEDCPFRKKRKAKVFQIQKVKKPQHKLKDIFFKELNEISLSNQGVMNSLSIPVFNIDFLNPFLSQKNVPSFNPIFEIDNFKLNLLEENQRQKTIALNSIQYLNSLKSFYHIPASTIEVFSKYDKKLSSNLFPCISGKVSAANTRDISNEKTAAAYTEFEFKFKY